MYVCMYVNYLKSNEHILLTNYMYNGPVGYLNISSCSPVLTFNIVILDVSQRPQYGTFGVGGGNPGVVHLLHPYSPLPYIACGYHIVLGVTTMVIEATYDNTLQEYHS